MHNQLNTNKVIVLGFGIIISILVLMITANIYIVSKNNQTISNIKEKKKQAEDILLMANAARQRAIYLFQMTLTDDAFDRDDIFLLYNEEALNVLTAFNSLRSQTPDETSEGRWNELLRLIRLSRKNQNKAADLIYIQNMKEANQVLFNKVLPIQSQVYSLLSIQHKEQEQSVGAEIASIRKLNLSAYWIVSLVGMATIFLSIGIAIFVFMHNKKSRVLEVEKKLAEDANEAKTEFLANMTHELRTPLHAILSYSTFGIMKENASREKRTGYFEKINISGVRLLKLVTNLLDLSKLESGKIDYNFNEVNLAHVLAECLDEITSLLQAKNIKIISTISEGLGTVFCDEALMYQVFQNLLSNAIKFSNNDSNIIVGLEAVKQLSLDKNKFYIVRFSVEDSGIGIENTELDMVFDKFIQSSLTKTGSGGTGLGLAICAEIINGHSGKIWAESDEGQGARFVFEIPLKKEPNASF